MSRHESSCIDAFRQALERYASDHPDESANVVRFQRLLADGRPAFDRGHLPGHFTASALVFDRRCERVLLTHHRKLDIWIQLGGHADGDARLHLVAHREAVEESGLIGIAAAADRIVDIDIHTIPAHGSEPRHDHYDVRYAFIADPTQPLVVSDESHDLAWVRVDRLGEVSEEASLHRAVGRALRAAVSDIPVVDR
jgi:ADP-ribose pyrophosphatase YjhB (NUDIX family)